MNTFDFFSGIFLHFLNDRFQTKFKAVTAKLLSYHPGKLLIEIRNVSLICQIFKKKNQKACESGFPYCFLTDFTKFSFVSLDFGFLAEKAAWIHRILKIWWHNKKNSKIQISLKLKGLDRFSPNFVYNIT